MNPRTPDITGQRFGRLVVTGPGAVKRGKRHWICRCDCGRMTEVSGYNLKCGNTTSCGCLHAERFSAIVREHNTTHGYAYTKTYESWRSMLSRCENPRAGNYHQYGAKGITVCERWHTFEPFLADMGERPEGQTLDRIDGTGNYEPGNCRWATPKQQRRNQRDVRLLTFESETLPIPDWAERLGVRPEVIYRRLDRNHWSVERALTVPPRNH